jgi:Delta3-Delta2-enoyl-CoA isomerase
MFPRNIFKLSKQFNLRSAKFLTPSLARCQSSSSKDLVLVNVNDKTGIATLTMNSLPVNSLNLELLTAFSKGLDVIGSNGSKGMILTSVR